jgi:hypothetical protein
VLRSGGPELYPSAPTTTTWAEVRVRRPHVVGIEVMDSDGPGSFQCDIESSICTRRVSVCPQTNEMLTKSILL